MKVLVADDMRATRFALRRNLTAWGYDVIEAEDGLQAWDLLNRDDPPRIAILDWMMPGLDGVEVCRKLRDRGKGPLVYTLLLTSKSEREDLVQALDSGAHSFQSKPISTEELRSHVNVGRRLVEADDRIQREVVEMERIQRSFLPPESGVAPGATYAALLKTYDRAGGDYYAFLNPQPAGPGQGSWAVLIADASGHGPSACMSVALIHAIVKCMPAYLRDPAGILTYINRIFSTSHDGFLMATAFCAVYDPDCRCLSYSRAGHPPPVMRREIAGVHDVWLLDGAGGFPFGAADDASYSSETLFLEKGDSLLLYTDGVVEAADNLQHLFGYDKLQDCVKNAPDTPESLIASVCEAVRAFEAGGEPQDDLAFVALRFE